MSRDEVMEDTQQAISDRRLGPICGLLIALALCCGLFASGVGTGYLFDDLSAVLPLQETLKHSPDLFWERVLSDRSGPLGRPLSILTFAIEQVFFQAGADFSQRVSIVVHTINAGLVFMIARGVFFHRGGLSAGYLALFVTLVWALSPQKISTVLYIVQRMAMLSAFFVLLALYSYQRFRCSRRSPRRAAFALVCVSSVLCAPFAKETGLLALPLLAAFELFVLSPARGADSDRRWRGAAIGILAAGCAGFCALGVWQYGQAEAAYALRQFDFNERLSSAPYILLDYARQFLLPDIGAMGLLHDDFPVIGPGQHPIAFYASLLICLAAGLATIGCAVTGRGGPLPFAVAVFFIGHSLESFYLPLELYFEHRNYLPSLGLALLAGAVIQAVLRHRARYRVLCLVVAAAYVSALLLLSYTLSTRWRSPVALLEHELQGHPRSARANVDYGFMLALGGLPEPAMDYVDKGYTLSVAEPAAKPMGEMDWRLLRVAVLCFAGQPFHEELKPLRKGGRSAPLHTSSIRVLTRAYADKTCPDGDWSALSAWMAATVFGLVQQGIAFPLPLVLNMLQFEQNLGNPLRIFMYAKLGLDSAPDRPEFHLGILQSSLVARDRVEARAALVTLHRLRERGRLEPLHRGVLDALEAQSRHIFGEEMSSGKKAR